MAVKSYNITDFGPSDLLTSERLGVRRVSVDSQQTSFEAGTEFYWSYDFEGVPANNDIIIRVTLSAPVILFNRIFNILSGSRLYRAYPAGYGETFTGTFTDESARIRPTNYNVDVNPDSGGTWEVNTGGVFTTGAAPHVGAPGSISTSGSGSNSQGQYSGSSLKLGYPAGAQFYIVFSNYDGGNAQTDLEFFMAWERLV